LRFRCTTAKKKEKPRDRCQQNKFDADKKRLDNPKKCGKKRTTEGAKKKDKPAGSKNCKDPAA